MKTKFPNFFQPISKKTSRFHTHPSHTQNSHLLTSSLSLGVPVPRATQCVAPRSMSFDFWSFIVPTPTYMYSLYLSIYQLFLIILRKGIEDDDVSILRKDTPAEKNTIEKKNKNVLLPSRGQGWGVCSPPRRVGIDWGQ